MYLCSSDDVYQLQRKHQGVPPGPWTPFVYAPSLYMTNVFVFIRWCISVTVQTLRCIYLLYTDKPLFRGGGQYFIPSPLIVYIDLAIAINETPKIYLYNIPNCHAICILYIDRDIQTNKFSHLPEDCCSIQEHETQSLSYNLYMFNLRCIEINVLYIYIYIYISPRKKFSYEQHLPSATEQHSL